MPEASPVPPVPVVLLHGAGLMPTMWQSQVEALGADRRAVAPWIAGLRPGRPVELSLPNAAADLLGLLERSGWARVAIVAHQLGAIVALEAASQAPERISRLMISGAFLPPSGLGLKLQKAAIKMMPASRLAGTGATKADLLRSLDIMAEAGFAQHPRNVTAETLVVVGAAEPLGAEPARQLASSLPNARLATIDGAAGTPSLENPEAFNKAMAEFLGR